MATLERGNYNFCRLMSACAFRKFLLLINILYVEGPVYVMILTGCQAFLYVEGPVYVIFLTGCKTYLYVEGSVYVMILTGCQAFRT